MPSSDNDELMIQWKSVRESVTNPCHTTVLEAIHQGLPGVGEWQLHTNDNSNTRLILSVTLDTQSADMMLWSTLFDKDWTGYVSR